MKEHFGWHLSYLLARELRVPNDPVTPPKIDQYFGIGIVHRESKSVPFDPFFIGKGFSKCFAQSNTGIFDGMMFINLQVALCLYAEVYFSMPCNLFEHVIKEP